MGRLQDILSMLTERRIGFKIDEQMKGTHTYVRDFEPGKVTKGTELPLEFKATWGPPKLSSFFNPVDNKFLFSSIHGLVTAGGLCLEGPMEGSLELRYLKDATIRYQFDFFAQGRPFRYVGEKRNIRPWNLHRTHTICYGTITDQTTQELLSNSVVYFDLRQLPKFLGSLRWE